MKGRQVAVALALAVCGVALVAVPVMGLGVAPTAQVDDASSANTTNGSFGQQVSSFMQASAADADASVERGMWQASVNRTVNESGDPAPQVRGRVAALERRLQQLQNRSDRLQERRGELPEMAYTARASALRAQIVNLRADINATARTATRVGVDASSLDTLRATAGNVTGPEVAATARAITDPPRGPPADVPGGPPNDRGPGGADRADRTPGGQGNATPPGKGRPQSAGDDSIPGGPATAADGHGPSKQPNGSQAPGQSENGAVTDASDANADRTPRGRGTGGSSGGGSVGGASRAANSTVAPPASDRQSA